MAASAEVAQDADAALREAHAALDAGRSEAARALAHAVLHQADRDQDLHLQARALSCLSYCDRLLSRVRRALDASHKAAQLFQQVGDIAGESTALATVSHSAASLGHNEEAVEAALLSIQLGELMPLGRQQALAYNYLGVAYFWSKCFDKAAVAFDASAALAERCTPAVSPSQPRLNRVWCEAVRVVSIRYQSGELPGLERMLSAMSLCDRLFDEDNLGGILPGFAVTARSVWHLTSGLRHCWSGNLDEARRQCVDARAWIDKYGTVTWLDALHAWLLCEIAWATKDWLGAERHAAGLVGLATQVEHEQLACMGHVLAAQIYEAQNKLPQALAEVRRMKCRELRIRSEGLESRARVVKWQLDTRSGQQHLRRLEDASRRFERLSMEDSLTGLPNRRCFEQRLERAMIGADSRSVAVALIDVDRFKQINDGHSHLVGDQVLRAIAGILRAQVRDVDLPARLGGDEFVLLLEGADDVAAEAVCRRVASAVRSHDWSAVAQGLCVTISVGHATAHACETAQHLLDRADACMYEVKSQTRA